MMLNDMLNTYDRHLTKINLNKSALWIVRDLNEKASLKKEIRVPFRAPLFLGKWYGVATYFSLYKKKILITKYMTESFHSLIE